MTAFFGGLLHPLLVPAHVMAMLALALLIGQQNWDRAAAVVYVAAVLAGLGAIALAYVPRWAEEGLLGSATLAGLLVALARPLPGPAVASLAGALGLALGLDSPPEVISLRDANLALLGTALGAVIVPGALATVTPRLAGSWPRIGVRILGSWIAASGILVLALRLLR